MTVGIGTTILGVVIIAATFALCVWAVRHQRRQFPKGNRTGWKPGPEGDPGWFATKITWLSGGRG